MNTMFDQIKTLLHFLQQILEMEFQCNGYTYDFIQIS